MNRPAVRMMFFAASLLGASARGDDDAPPPSIVEKIESRLKSKEYVGVVVGVVESRGAKPKVFGFGTTELGKSTRPDGRTIFEIGSITKAFTSIALADLVVEKKTKLDAPLRSLLPEDVVAPKVAGAEITLEDLATHRSGLPRLPSIVFARTIVGKDPYADVFEKDLFAFLSKWKPTAATSRDYAYSNLGAGLLGVALARREGVSFEELLRRKILNPLKLDDTSLEVPEAKRDRLAKPYESGGKPGKSWRFDAMAGCGGLRSTADDMLVFLVANLDPKSVAPPLGEALELASIARRDTTIPGTRIALGWHVSVADDPDAPLVWHNGGTGGYCSFAGFHRKTGRAVIVLANSNTSVDDLGFSLFPRDRSARTSKEADKPLKNPEKTR